MSAQPASSSSSKTEMQYDKVAHLIQNASRVCALLGAGLSVSADIPDFRSRGGLYDTLRPELLTASAEDKKIMQDDPTWVVNQELFLRRKNPLPYHEVRRPFILGLLDGKYLPTAGHHFLALLDQRFNMGNTDAAAEKKGSDKKDNSDSYFRIFDQNIEGLTLKALGSADAARNNYVTVHGSLLLVRCENCLATGADVPSFEDFANKIVRTQVKDIYQKGAESWQDSAAKESNPDAFKCPKCGRNALKPSTIMYGGAMPDAFFLLTEKSFGPLAREREQQCDLLLAVGSSLTVHPAASLPQHLDKAAPLVVMNRDPVPVQRPYEHLSSDIDESACEIAARIPGMLAELEKLATATPPRMAPKSIATVRRIAAAKRKAALDDAEGEQFQ